MTVCKNDFPYDKDNGTMKRALSRKTMILGLEFGKLRWNNNFLKGILFSFI